MEKLINQEGADGIQSAECSRFQRRLSEIESKLSNLEKRRGFIRDLVIIFLAALTLAAALLFGFGILHPRSSTPVETTTAPEGPVNLQEVGK